MGCFYSPDTLKLKFAAQGPVLVVALYSVTSIKLNIFNDLCSESDGSGVFAALDMHPLDVRHQISQRVFLSHAIQDICGGCIGLVPAEIGVHGSPICGIASQYSPPVNGIVAVIDDRRPAQGRACVATVFL